MLSSFPLIILFLCLTHHAAGEYLTLVHKAFNYTYAGQEVGRYHEALDWCTRLGGHLPSIHSKADIDFLADELMAEDLLTEDDSVWLGARRFYDSWQWNDDSPFDFTLNSIHQPPNSDYGLILTLGMDEEEGKKVRMMAFADKTPRRMVCRITSPSLSDVRDLQSTVERLEKQISSQEQELNASVARLVRENNMFADKSADKESRQQALTADADSEAGTYDRDAWLIILTILTAMNSMAILFFAAMHFKKVTINQRPEVQIKAANC